jgi:hypothetical protein
MMASEGWDIMFNNPTFSQAARLLEFFKETKATHQQIQNILESGDLVKMMLKCPNLSQVNRSMFSSALVSVPWTPVAEYADRIFKRSELRNWGFSRDDVDNLAESLRNHTGPLQPTGVTIWLGHDLEFNYAELSLWLKEETEALGYDFTDWVSKEAKSLSFRTGSKFLETPTLKAVGLDLKTFWDNRDGIIPKDVIPARRKWPSLEVLVLLALNPQFFALMDGDTIPSMIAPGLIVDNNSIPRFGHHNNKISVFFNQEDSAWYQVALVSFRKY